MRERIAAVLGALAVTTTLTFAVAAPSVAQAPVTAPAVECQVQGRPCLTPDQQAQVEAIVAGILQQPVTTADGAVAQALEGIVRQWVNHAVQFGYAIAFSFLPG